MEKQVDNHEKYGHYALNSTTHFNTSAFTLIRPANEIRTNRRVKARNKEERGKVGKLHGNGAAWSRLIMAAWVFVLAGQFRNVSSPC